MKFIVRLLAFTLLPLGCFAQFTITGRVLNQADTKPIADASVFLNNTVTGDRTTKDGTFRLENVKPGKYKLVISIIGFERYDATVNVTNGDIRLPDVTIFPKTTALKEVTITVNHNREKYFSMYYERFKNAFLGTSDMARDCRIVNPDMLDFDYDTETKTLSVSSADFLEIDNDDLGYKINYLLTTFKLNDATNHLHYEGPVFFTEMKGSPMQERRWLQNRRQVYEGSEMHFLRAILNDALEDEGFQAFQLATYPNPDRLPDNILTDKLTKFEDPSYRKSVENQSRSGCKGCIIDSLPFYKKMAKLPKTLQTLFPYTLNERDLVLSTPQPGLFALDCDGAAIIVEYDKNHHFTPAKRLQVLGNLDYSLNRAGNKRLTLISFKSPYLLFDTNGWTTDPNNVSISGAWGANRVADLLPVNYETQQNKSDIVRADTVFNVLKNKMETFATGNPVEKVHLHLDRPQYSQGDTIWFKAYTVAGALHVPTTISNVLYTELINDKDSIINRHVIPLSDGAGKGDFVIPFTYKSGTYRLRAYTNYMRNDSDYFYDQRITIGGLEPAQAAGISKISTANTTNHPSQTAYTKPDVQFFPEGGELVMGLRSKVAFKAVTSDGSAASIAGVIADQDGTEVASFSTQYGGMGQFPLTPLPGKLYTAKISCADGTGFLVDLPKAKEAGFTLTVNNAGDSIYVKVAANDALYGSMRDTSFYVIAQSGGKYYFAAGGKVANRVFTTQIPKDRFPSGIVQFTLFSQKGEPLNERAVFVQNDDQLKLDISPEKQSFAPNENIQINLAATNRQGTAGFSSFSVSVNTEVKEPADKQTETTILADLLLTSELKGYMANPDYYFGDKTDKIRSDLDLLMLTRGNHRFEWKRILAGDDKVTFKPEKMLAIEGLIKTPNGVAIPGVKISMTCLTQNFSADTLTDADGRFKFDKLNLTDSVKLFIKAQKKGEKSDYNIFIRQPAFPAPGKLDVTNIDAGESPKLAMQNQPKIPGVIPNQLPSKKTIVLKEVKIKSSKAQTPGINNKYGADNPYTVNGERVKDFGVVHNALVGLLPARITGNGVLVSIHGMPPVPYHIVLNSVEIDFSAVDNFVNADEVENIKILEGFAYKSIYGIPFNPRYHDDDDIILITTKQFAGTAGAHGKLTPVTLKMPDGSGGFPDESFLTTSVPANTMVYPFVGYNNEDEFSSASHRKLPDDSKTIYWNPDIITDANGKASFQFTNAATPGTYCVVVEGIDGNGNIGRQVYRYKVQ